MGREEGGILSWVSLQPVRSILEILGGICSRLALSCELKNRLALPVLAPVTWEL